MPGVRPLQHTIKSSQFHRTMKNLSTAPSKLIPRSSVAPAHALQVAGDLVLQVLSCKRHCHVAPTLANVSRESRPAQSRLAEQPAANVSHAPQRDSCTASPTTATRHVQRTCHASHRCIDVAPMPHQPQPPVDGARDPAVQQPQQLLSRTRIQEIRLRCSDTGADNVQTWRGVCDVMDQQRAG